MVAPLGRRSGRKISQVRKFIFLSVNMKNCGRRNVRKQKEIKGSDKNSTLKKHKEIRGSDKYVTLDISSKFDSLENMNITSSESKRKLEISGKWLITSLGYRTKASFAKIQKGKVCHRKGQ